MKAKYTNTLFELKISEFVFHVGMLCIIFIGTPIVMPLWQAVVCVTGSVPVLREKSAEKLP